MAREFRLDSEGVAGHGEGAEDVDDDGGAWGLGGGGEVVVDSSVVARAEDGGAHAHQGGALLDGHLEVAAHAHAQLGQRVSQGGLETVA